MTDTQPTKFCVDCKHYSEYFDGPRMCHAPRREQSEPDLVTGTRRYVNGSDPKAVRENECKGQWWEQMQPFEYTPETVDSGESAPQPRPSIFQRIKRWFKW